jgi:hypothetical protein
VEIEGLAKIFFNKWGYYLTLFLLIISLQATNISSIIISAQVASLLFYLSRWSARTKHTNSALITFIVA